MTAPRPSAEPVLSRDRREDELARTESIRHLSQWLRLLLGLILVFALFHWSADALGSDRGQSGVIVGALVVAATIAIERAIFGQPVLSSVRTLGLGRPRAMGLAVAGAVVLLLWFVVLVFVLVTGASAALVPGWAWLMPGLFAQGGIAEEILFRGYLFGHLRRGRSFWRAAGLSMPPFVAVHLLLFLTMPWPIALAALVLSVVLSFPLAHLFELGGHTIWAAALLHFVIQATVKVVVVTGDSASVFPLVWMAASAVLPLFVLLISRRSSTRHAQVGLSC